MASDGNIIDSLSIQINASVSQANNAISNLQKKLEVLNRSLENFTDSGKYLGAINNLASGFERVTNALDDASISKIQNLAQALKTLSASAEKVGKSFQTVVKYPETLEEHVAKDLTETFETFGIKGSNNVKQLTKSFIDLYNQTDKDLDAQWMRTAEQIQEMSTVTHEATDAFHGLLDAIKSFKDAKVNLGSGTGAEYRDKFLGMMSTGGTGAGGSRLWTTDLNKATSDFEEYVKQINAITGGLIPVQHFNDGSRAEFEAYVEVVKRAIQEQQEFANGGEKVKFSMEFMSSEIMNAMKSVEASMGTFKQGAVEEIVSPIERIVPALKELSAVKVPEMSGLADLVAQLQKLGNKNPTKGAEILPMITQGLQGMKDITLPDFTPLANLVSAISSLGNKNPLKAADALPKITEFLTGLSFVQMPNMEGFDSLATAIRELGSANAKKAAENLPVITVALNDLMTSLGAMPSVSENTIRLVEALGNLNASNMQVTQSNDNVSRSVRGVSASSVLAKRAVTALIEPFKTAWKHTNSFQTALKAAESGVKSFYGAIGGAAKSSLSMVNIFGKMKESVNNLWMSFVKLRSVVWGFKMVAGMFSGVMESASSLVEVQNVVRHVYDPTYIDEFNRSAENTINTLGLSKLSFEQFASRYQAMGKALGITNGQMQEAESHLKQMGVEYGSVTGKMGDMSVNLTRLAGDMASFYDVDVDSVYKSLQAVYTGQTRPLNIAA